MKITQILSESTRLNSLDVTEAANAAQRAAIAVNMKKYHKKPKHNSISETNVEPIQELSSDALDRYKVKAKKSSDELTSQGKYRQANDRTMNVMKATGKQIDNTVTSIRKSLNRESVEQDVAESSVAADDVVGTLNSYGYYTKNSRDYVNDKTGDMFQREGSQWRHQSGVRGRGPEELDWFLSSLSSKQDVTEGSSEIKIPTEDGITMQDIRLMAGEGPLTKKTILQAIAVIRKQRRPQGVAEDYSESKSNVTSAITDFYKSQLSQSKPGKVENYNSKAKELLSQATGKQRTKVLTMLKAGSKNPYLQGVIITIVGSIVSGAVIKHFGSMGLSPQQFNMILQGSMNSIIPTLAAKLHGMSWSDAIKTGLASVAVGVGSAGIMEDNAEYDDESGMAHTNLHTIIRAAEGLLDTIDDNENLPEWVQEKIANVEGMIVSSWDYLISQEEQGIDPQVNESNWLQEELNKLDEVAAWQKKSGKNKTGGLNQKGVNSYRREHPGSKLQTAVTTKPSKLKPGSKAAKRRKSFCARMSGVKGPMKKDGKPTRKALALRKWNC
jgi:hypothetical protein